MLTLLGIGTVAALLLLILFRITSVLVALTLVPLAAALIGGFAGNFGTWAMDGIRGVTPVAALLAFAVIYFGVMNDAGLFDPIIRALVRVVGTDPVRIALGTAAVASVAHLDGAGASTFMVTVPAMLPLYNRVRMSALSLTCITALAAGTMNMLPWGGPTTRAATALQVSATQLFVPVIPAMVAGMIGVFVFAVRIGRHERRRLARGPIPLDAEAVADSAEPAAALHGPPEERAFHLTSLRQGHGGPPKRFARRRKVEATKPSARRFSGLWFFNAALTAVTLAVLFSELVPLALVFMIASAIALVVNYPSSQQQRERLTSHGETAMLMVTTIFAAGVFTGVLTKSGMLASMTTDLVAILPAAALRHLPIIMAVLSMPLSLVFDPDSFYFGLLPVLSHAADVAGGSGIEVARAAVLGQMTTGFPVSPLTPATFLLVGLANVDLADHQRRTIPYAFGVTLLMALAALVTGALRL
jgi:citrate-Mg2+:H+ or citrate-Ca2+:H+ symporter, CitMHS family